jgi:ABC-type multidrug transport system fused ATPase/permease subunit
MIRARVASIRRMLRLLGVSSGEITLLVGLGLIVAIFEGAGIGLLVPVLQYVEQGPQVFEESRLAEAVTGMAAPFGIGPSLPLLFVAAFVPVLGRQLFGYLRQLYAARIRFGAIARIRREGAVALLDADLAFVLGRGEARLTGTLTSEVERCASALPMFLQIVESTLLIAIYLVALLVLSAPLMPVMVAAMLVTAITIRAKIRYTERWGQEVASQLRALQVAITERLIGFRLVKLRGRAEEETAFLGELIDRVSASQTRISAVKEALNALVEPIMLGGVFVALYVAVGVIGVGLASLGVFGLIVTRLVPLIRQVNDARLGIAALVGGLEEINSQAEAAKATAVPAHDGLAFPGLCNDLVFDNVSFRYDGAGETFALRDVSFRATRGSLTAIVGRSGAGKSTLLDLVPRLRQVTSGEIRIDGVPLDRFDVTSLRLAVGFVDQQGFLFEGTVAANIAYGSPHAKPDAIVDAARRAHAAQFIEQFPQGYSTLVGHRGHRLSAGQRQRVCIARMLLQDPDVFLLDEPTSALDGESEQYIGAVLDDVRTRKAVIVVAHRLSTIRSADQIIVLDGGRVVEQGQHDALLAQSGTYHQLFDRQLHD